MRRVLIMVFVGLSCLFVGLGLGVAFGPKMKSEFLAKFPWAVSLAANAKDSQFETYDYPTIKFKAKPLADAQGAIVQLWTRYESDKPGDPQSAGKMNYRLTVFKAPGKTQCEIQLLDDMGFKLAQFDASDFHQLPGTADISESRDSFQCSEDLYKKVRDYSIK